MTRRQITTAVAGVVMMCGWLVGCTHGPRYGGAWEMVAGDEWVLRSLDGDAVLKGSRVTLTLASDGRAVGHAGVNRYFGTYEQDGSGGLRFGAMGATRMAGSDPPGVMDQESRYLGVMDRVEHYRVEPGQLELFTAKGERLVFEQAVSE